MITSYPVSIRDVAQGAPHTNIIVVGLGGYGSDVVIASGGLGVRAGEPPFRNALIVDSDLAVLERPGGRRFIDGGGEVIRLNRADLRHHMEAALEERSSATYAKEIQEIWGGHGKRLADYLKAAETGRGGSGIRTVSASSCFSAAQELLQKIEAKCSESRKSNPDPRAVTKVILVCSMDGSVGSGASTALAYLLLANVPGLEICVHAGRHNPREIAGYTGNEARARLLRANAGAWIGEMERLAEAATSISRTSSISVIELALDREQAPLTTRGLVVTHARALRVQYNLGVDPFHERRRINETFMGRTGPFRVIGCGVAYEIPTELITYGSICMEEGFIHTLLKKGETFPSLESVLSQSARVTPPPDRTESVLAATSVAGAMTMAGKLEDDLKAAEADLDGQLNELAQNEKCRVSTEVGAVIAHTLPLHGIGGARRAVTMALQSCARVVEALKSKIEKARPAASCMDDGCGTAEERAETSFQRFKALPRAQQAGLGAATLVAAVLIAMGDAVSTGFGLALLAAAGAAAFFLLKVRSPKVDQVIESLILRLRARRDLIARNAELTVQGARMEALETVSMKLVNLENRLIDRLKHVQLDSERLAIEEDPTRYCVLNREEFADVVKKWPSFALDNLPSVEAETVLNLLARRASVFAEAQYSNVSFSNLPAPSPEALERIANLLGSSATAPDVHHADPGRIPPPELFTVSSRNEVSEGEMGLRKALQSASDAKGIYVLGWQRGLQAADLRLNDELQAAAAAMTDVPTRTLPRVLGKTRVMSEPAMKSRLNGHAFVDHAA